MSAFSQKRTFPESKILLAGGLEPTQSGQSANARSLVPSDSERLVLTKKYSESRTEGPLAGILVVTNVFVPSPTPELFAQVVPLALT